MLPTQQGAFRLFRLFGIDVSVHWSWFLLAAYRFQNRHSGYQHPIFFVAEFLSLFLIVTMHEFGHSLSCRQVGGQADQIILWPFGGVAYVRPPNRPGAQLWSIAAGPLVNVALLPVLGGLMYLSAHAGWEETGPDLDHLITMVFYINAALLVFNVLPIYPLDGGQILRSILWFFVGRGRSLMIAAAVGFVGVAGLGLLAAYWGSLWLGFIAAFVFMQCLQGWKHARLLRAAETVPRRTNFACPACRVSPPVGEMWVCARCQGRFDIFANGGRCPDCEAHYEETRCPECGQWATMDAWARAGGRVPAAGAEKGLI